MYVTLEARSPCVLCGFRFRFVMFGPVRVNKRSMRTTGPVIGTSGEHACPECRWPNRSDLAPRSPYVLDTESVAAVAEYRLKRWGIEPGEVPVERAS